METNIASEAVGIELEDEIVTTSEVDWETLTFPLRAIKVRNRVWTARYWHNDALRKVIETLTREQSRCRDEIEYQLDQPGGFSHGYVGKNGKFYRTESEARWTFPEVI